MSKLALIFLLFVSVISAAYQRPWENQSWVSSNPNIFSYGVELWWNVPELHKTMESLEFQDIEYKGGVKTYVDQAKLRKKQTEENYWACTSDPHLDSLWLMAGPHVSSFMSLLSEFSKISNCITYKSNWIAVVDSSLNSLEQSSRDASISIASARKNYDEINFLGLCNVNFTYRDSQNCAGMEAAFIAIDNNLTEGKYGGYNLFLTTSKDIEKELLKPEPNLSSLTNMLALIWDDEGAISLFDNLNQTAVDIKHTNEQRFDSLLSTANGREMILASNIAEMEKQRLYLIQNAPSSFEAQKTETVKILFENLKQEKNKVDVKLQQAELVRWMVFQQNYLADAIMETTGAADEFDALIEESSDILDSARVTVQQQKNEAEEEILKASAVPNPSPSAVDTLNEAKKFFEEGENTQTFGDQFLYYSKAAALARSASDQRNYESEALIQSSIAQLEELIANAKKDGINVVAEEENLAMLKELDSYQVETYVQSSINSIISKAKTKYDDSLIDLRSIITDMISFAGPSAADLSTDLEKYEQGMITDGKIDYLNSIGRLSELMDNYLYLEEELSQYMGAVVGNILSTTASPLIYNVFLDEPADVELDVMFANNKKYGAQNVNTRVTLPSVIPFLYSDIESGQESVEGIYVDGNDLVITFNEVAPFETKRVQFSKKIIAADTVSKKTSAEGIGNGAAYVDEVLEFELGFDIPRLELLQDLSNTLIDGADPGRPLKKGTHTMTSQRTLSDAYEETVTEITSYPLGINSQVEYNIKITPKMDLDSVSLFIDSLNNSAISSLNVFCATGEKLDDVERISETQYTAKIFNLKENSTAVVRVSYLVEDTESFVRRQISELENMNASETCMSVLDEAKIQTAAGNHTKALELVETFKQFLKEEQKQVAKLQKEYDELNKKFSDEFAEILEVLPSAPLNSSFTEKLSARKDELERISEELLKLNLSAKVDLLDQVDYKWAGKEINSLKKDSYKEYNDLRERFFIAGNSSTPKEFLEFEAVLNKLEVGSRLEYAVETVKALSKVQLLVDSQEKTYQENSDMLKLSFESLKSETEDVLDMYLKQASAAKGTDYSSLFTETERKVESLIKEADPSSSKDTAMFLLNMDNLNKSKIRMDSTLASLQNESRAKILLVENIVQDADPDMQDSLVPKIATMKSMHESGDYINALRAGNAIAKELDSQQEPDNDAVLILGITALAVLAAIAAYIVKQQKPKKKELRKVPKAESTPLL